MTTLYSQVDVILLPSLFEGFPNVILEGMAMGKIVVSTDVSDAQYIINNGENGFLIDDPNDVSSFVDRVESIQLLSFEEKKRICTKARKTALNYSKNIYLSTFEQLISKIRKRKSI